jgi:hypothetical protein
MAIITWLDKIDGSDAGNPQKNVNAADMNQIKTVTNTNAGLITTAQGEIDAHEALTNNPHSVTKTQVGLSNVTNEAQLPLTLTANKNVTGDFALSLGTNANHLDSLYVYTETQLFLHAQDSLIINVHAAVGTDVVGETITPNGFTFAAGFANSTVVEINDENTSTGFSVVTNDGSIILTAVTGFNIELNADNIIINGNIKITGGSPGAGKVLTSDADGDSSWQTPSVAAGSITGVLGIANGGNGTTTGISTETQAALNLKTAALNHAKRVTPSGAMNGINVTYTIGETIVAGTDEVFYNGQQLIEGVTYTISGSTITMTLPSPPVAEDYIRVNFIRP